MSEQLYRKEASNASDHDHVCDDMNGCFRLMPVERCEHDKLDPHPTNYRHGISVDWCEGAALGDTDD